MKKISIILSVVLFAAAGWAENKTVDRLYVLDCGIGYASNKSLWTNGMEVGVPWQIAGNCYLVKHGNDYFLWDTGISDDVASMPNGWQASGGPYGIRWTRSKTLASELAKVGVKPADIHWIGISHAHSDHVGNVEHFPNSVVYIQKAEYLRTFAIGPENPAVMQPIGQPPAQTWFSFRGDHAVKLVEGDTDVFGDGSVIIVFTPGHTPGHQSCLIHLANTGWVLLSGDAVHMQANWDNRRVPRFASLTDENKDRTLLSMQRMADLMSFYKAQLWISHDLEQTKKQKHAPEFYD